MEFKVSFGCATLVRLVTSAATGDGSWRDPCSLLTCSRPMNRSCWREPAGEAHFAKRTHAFTGVATRRFARSFPLPSREAATGEEHASDLSRRFQLSYLA